jgi:hypothetical protein
MSESLNRDPINSAIYDGVKRGIKVCLENECFGSAVILTYSGIDTMAYLAMPHNQTDVTRDDFVQWCDKYICFSGQEQLTGLELYGARCGMLHTYGVESRLTRGGDCRKLGYMDRSVPEIRYSEKVDPNFALVSIEALAKAFCDGVDRFLVDLFADSARAAVAERRLQQLVVAFPISPNP